MTDIHESKAYQFRESRANKRIILFNVILFGISFVLAIFFIFNVIVSSMRGIGRSSMKIENPLHYYLLKTEKGEDVLRFDDYDEEHLMYSYKTKATLSVLHQVTLNGLVSAKEDGVSLSKTGESVVLNPGTHEYVFEIQCENPFTHDKNSTYLEFTTDASQVEFSDSFRTFSESDLTSHRKRIYTDTSLGPVKLKLTNVSYVCVGAFAATFIYTVLDIGKGIVLSILISKEKRQIRKQAR